MFNIRKAYENKFLTISTIILFILAYKFEGKWIKILNLRQNDNINISKTHMSNTLKILEKRKLVEREKFGKQVKARITGMGFQFIHKFPKKISEDFEEFFVFLEDLGVFGRSYINNHISITDRECNKKPNKHDRMLEIYTNVENNVLEDKIIHFAFDFLNKHPQTSKVQLEDLFPDASPSYLSQIHRTWHNITYEKHVLNEK